MLGLGVYIEVMGWAIVAGLVSLDVDSEPQHRGIRSEV
jgi:hypothetical protein